MDEIVLNVNLKYVLATLDMYARGELLTALFEGAYQGSNEAVANVFLYIFQLQQERAAYKTRMRDLSAKGVAARLKKSLQQAMTVAADKPAVDHRLLRKEAKESESKNNLNLFSLMGQNENLSAEAGMRSAFVAPSVAEVRRYVTANGLKVDADNFVNFYESHGWMVGSTPIRSWRATLKLWHARALKAEAMKQNKTVADDETYWHDLALRVAKAEPESSGCHEDVLVPVMPLETRQTLPPQLHCRPQEVLDETNCSPFARFMRRVEKYDLISEK